MSKQIKSAQDIIETLRRVGTQAGSSLGDAGQRMTNWWSHLNPEAKGAIVRGLAGAAVGGGITGTLAGMTPKDPEEHKAKSVIRSALLGSVLGGVGAAGFPVAEKMFGGQIRFKGEGHKDVLSKYLIDPVLGVPIHHPLAAAGGALGTAGYHRWTVPFLESASTGAAPGQRGIFGSLLHGQGGRASRLFQAAAREAEQATGRGFPLPKSPPGTTALPTGEAIKAMSRARRLAKFGPWAIPAGLLLGGVMDKYIRGDM